MFCSALGPHFIRILNCKCNANEPNDSNPMNKLLFVVVAATEHCNCCTHNRWCATPERCQFNTKLFSFIIYCVQLLPTESVREKNEEEEELRFVSNGHLCACDVDPISMNVCECVCISGLFHWEAPWMSREEKKKRQTISSLSRHTSVSTSLRPKYTHGYTHSVCCVRAKEVHFPKINAKRKWMRESKRERTTKQAEKKVHGIRIVENALALILVQKLFINGPPLKLFYRTCTNATRKYIHTESERDRSATWCRHDRLVKLACWSSSSCRYYLKLICMTYSRWK